MKEKKKKKNLKKLLLNILQSIRIYVYQVSLCLDRCKKTRSAEICPKVIGEKQQQNSHPKTMNFMQCSLFITAR